MIALTPRERQALELAAAGYTNYAAARALGVARHTVASHLYSARRKLDVPSTLLAVLEALRRGEIEVAGLREAAMPELPRRTWIYAHRPATYEWACDRCGGLNVEWSEYDGLIWCYDCQVDTRGTGGIFDGPLALGALELLGISLDRIDLATGRRLRCVLRDGRLEWEAGAGVDRAGDV